VFIGREIEELDHRPWREVYSQILDDTGMKASLQSISAILAAAFHKSKSQTEAEICGAIIRTFDDREGYQAVRQHPLFEQYVIKRVKELRLRVR
jgi:hypothetical protein